MSEKVGNVEVLIGGTLDSDLNEINSSTISNISNTNGTWHKAKLTLQVIQIY